MVDVKEFNTLREARAAYHECMPRFVDVLKNDDQYAGHHGPARVLLHDSSSEAVHVNVCPDYDHDCIREGCGREWSESFSYGAVMQVQRRGKWRDVAFWENFEKGGIGF